MKRVNKIAHEHCHLRVPRWRLRRVGFIPRKNHTTKREATDLFGVCVSKKYTVIPKSCDIRYYCRLRTNDKTYRRVTENETRRSKRTRKTVTRSPKKKTIWRDGDRAQTEKMAGKKKRIWRFAWENKNVKNRDRGNRRRQAVTELELPRWRAVLHDRVSWLACLLTTYTVWSR